MPRAASNSEVYCWLKQRLEPDYSVTARPESGYFSEHRYHYLISRNGILIHEMQGDFRHLSEGQLIETADQLLQRLNAAPSASKRSGLTEQRECHFPMASRVPPKTGSHTWFNAGRSAFAWLISQHPHLRSIHIPTYLCWSLINVLQTRFPHIDISFYSVDRRLHAQYPQDVDDDEAILIVHYFGKQSSVPSVPSNAVLMHDCSHMPVSLASAFDGYVFGSLRKVYRTAGGGFLRGAFNPIYEGTRNQDAWLRKQASDWKDLREAENMTDRDSKIGDIDSQSLATVLTDDDQHIRERRSANQQQLANGLSIGQPMVKFDPDDSPLLHNCLLPTTQDRDSLRSYLADRDIYCSVHWPAHPILHDLQDHVDCTDAHWIANHVLSFPVSQHYGEEQMTRVCQACDDWHRAGSARFGQPAA